MNWRSFGSPHTSEWAAIVTGAGGPAELASNNACHAAGDHGWLCLAMLHVESKFAQAFNLNKPENKNPLNLRPAAGGGYMSFGNYADGIQTWRDRLLSPTYKSGVYHRTRSLEDLIHVYAPSDDGNNEAAYVATIATLFLTWGVTPKETPMPTDITFGKVPYPVVTESHLSAASPWVQTGAPAIPEAVFWHRMIGTLWGTDVWFHGGNAATAYGVGIVSIDGADDAGKIIEWMSRASGHYGESSGPAVGPYGDGAKLIAKVGVGNVNRVTKAIEISGNYDTPLDEPARKTIVAMTAYFADQKHIPWNEFPNVPGEDRSYIVWHNEITGMAYKACPGSVVMAETPALIKRVADLLRFHQVGTVVPTPPVYVMPILPAWWDDALEQNYPGDQSENGVKLYALRRNFVAIGGTRRLDRADGKEGKRVGPNLKTREKVHVERWRSDGWAMTVEGHYIALSKLSPKVKIAS